ncbi:hypothetical protein AGMMS49991_06290 [Spirochaetia bacterium]|nr:hypothetical protein AGMMS49991_06290 [Spirochaetia bacterium]
MIYDNVLDMTGVREKNQKIGDLPYKLTQISGPARKYLKILAVGLIQYHKESRAREPEVFSLKKNKAGGFHA